MKRLRKLILLLILPLALFSCGKIKVYGEYVFQMGGDKSTHFGVFLNLTDKPVMQSHSELGKEFQCGMKLSDDVMPKEPDPNDPNYIEEAFMYTFMTLMNVEGEDPGPGLEGYYNVGKKVIEDKGERLYLTISLADIPLIEDEYLDKLLVAYVDGKKIQLTIPVSLPDFQCQLCWYGLLICPIEIDVFHIGDEPLIVPFPIPIPDEELPGVHGDDRIGTHPTSQQVDTMNEIIKNKISVFREFTADEIKTLLALFEIIITDDEAQKIVDALQSYTFTFRDFHVLDVELLRK